MPRRPRSFPSARPQSHLTSAGVARGGFEGVVDPATRRALFDINRSLVELEHGGGGGGGAGGSVPLGTIIDYYGATAPSGYLECNGTTFDALAYPDLNTHLGGNTLPDLRDRSTIGRSATAANGTVKGSADSSVPQHQHASTLAAPAHTHSVDPPSTQVRFTGGGQANDSGVLVSTPGVPNMWIVNNVGSTFPATQMRGDVDIPSFASGAASATALTGSIGNVSGATAAVAGSNYHPVMAVMKCIRAVL